MEERLVVKNFGPIKDMDIRIGKLTVLIGEQATGKSTLGKLLAVCKDFDAIKPEFLPDESFLNSLNAYGIHGFLNTETVMQFKSHDYSLDLTAYNEIGTFIDWDSNEEYYDTFLEAKFDSKPISELYKSLFKEYSSLSSEDFEADLGWSARQNFYKTRVYPNVQDAFYIPTERLLQSIFTLGKDTISDISSKLFEQFSQIDAVQRLFKDDTEIEPLGIEYKNDNGIGYFRKIGSEKYHKMQNAASGYQSVIPIVLLLTYYTQIRKKKKSFIIEEPELNLFPVTQHKLMQYLVSNLNKTENQIVITTHSPYVLSSINVLLNAWQAGQKDPEATEKVIPKEYWLNPKDVTAYALKSDGTCESIVNIEEGIIKSEKIDEVSDILNRQFDSLLNIQFGIEDETA